MGTVEKPATLPWDPDPRFVVEPEPVAPDDEQRGLVAGCAFVAAVGVLAFLAGVALGWVM